MKPINSRRQLERKPTDQTTALTSDTPSGADSDFAVGVSLDVFGAFPGAVLVLNLWGPWGLIKRSFTWVQQREKTTENNDMSPKKWNKLPMPIGGPDGARNVDLQIDTAIVWSSCSHPKLQNTEGTSGKQTKHALCDQRRAHARPLSISNKQEGRTCAYTSWAAIL